MLMQVQSGCVNLESPTIKLKDIVHALSHICRYTGNCDPFWSVGNHVLLCYELRKVYKPKPKFHLPILLHDAPEYLLNDMAGPYKAKLGEWYAKAELTVEQAVAKKFGIEQADFNAPEVKQVDYAALYIESKVLFPNRDPVAWKYLDDQYSAQEALFPYIAALGEAAALNQIKAPAEVREELLAAILTEMAE